MIFTLAAIAILGNHSAVVQADQSTNFTDKISIGQWNELNTEVQKNGKVNVLVSLNAPDWDKIKYSDIESQHTKAEAIRIYSDAQLALAGQVRDALAKAMASYNVKQYRGSTWYIPGAALTVDKAALDYLATSPLVKSISADYKGYPQDESSAVQTGAAVAWHYGPPNTPGDGNGYTGANEYVFVLDSGVETLNNYFYPNSNGVAYPNNPSRIDYADGACFSGGGITDNNGVLIDSLCTGRASNIIGGDTEPCPNTIASCDHGTAVAGIIGGFDSTGNSHIYSGNGPAYQATIIPMMIGSIALDGSNQAVFYNSDITTALSRVQFERTRHFDYLFAAVNMSLGNNKGYSSDSGSGSACETDSQNPNPPGGPAQPVADAIAKLSGSPYNIQIVVSAGESNTPSSTGIGFPACVTSAISVGAVDFKDNIWSQSNHGPNTTIFAPGIYVATTSPGSKARGFTGTSASAAQVSGALALLQEETGNKLTVPQLKSILTKTGRLIGVNHNQVRMDLAQAVLDAVNRQDTVGVYRTTNDTFYLRKSNSSGVADYVIPFGSGTSNYPVAGNWSGRTFIDDLVAYSYRK